MEKNEVEKDIIELFESTDKTIQQIADTLGMSYKIVWTFISKTFSKEERYSRKVHNYQRSKLGSLNPMTGKCGDTHPNYVGEVSDGKGYIIVLKPEWYTGRKGSKHVFKHTVVMCEHLGLSELPPGFVIHHIDFDKTNNDIDNLVLLTNSAHSKLHSVLKRATTIPQGSRE